MGDKEYISRMVASYLETLSKKAVFVKQQDLQGILIEEVCNEVSNKDTIKTFFYDYTIYEMKDAYEPFMMWIKQAYYSDFADRYTVEEFVENCSVYSLQREVFSSYIRNDICERNLEVLMNEYEYEKERFMESLYTSLKYIAGDRILVFVIGRLHMAPVCVMEFLNRIFDREDSIRFIFTYGETFLVREYCHNEWHSLLQKAEEGKMFLMTKRNDVVQNPEFPDNFYFDEDKIGSYIKSLNNMVHFFAFRDAVYYLDIILTCINRIDSKVSDEYKFKMLELLGEVYLGMGDYKDALLTCEKMVPLFTGRSEIYREYIYNYFSAKAHLIMEDSGLTHKFCNNCRPLAEKMKNELLLMNIDIIDTMAEFGSMKEIFRCNFSYRIKESVLERAKEAGNENFLAYMYVFGYDNDIESVKLIGCGEKEPVYFNMGIDIAEKLENVNLLSSAYMKNIILYSTCGCHRYVREMYEKRLKIIDKNKPVKIAHMQGGLGYNAIVLEDYATADEYFKKSLDTLIRYKKAEDVAEILYNMFINFYVSGYNEKVTECIELILKIIELLHIQSIRICNTSKMYGMLSLAYYKLGQYMDCYYCMDRMEMVLSYVLNKNDESEEKLWLEDLFLYHLCKASLFSYENNIDKAKEHFALSYKYMKKNDGIKYYAYAEYAVFYAGFLKKLGLESERNAILQEAYEYCMNNEYPMKAAMLKAELNNIPYDMKISYTTDKLPVDAIMDVSRYEGTRIELEKRKKDIDFMTLCHNIMGRDENKVPDVVNQTMNLIRNSFSFDRIIFLETKAEHCDFTYIGENVNLNQKDANELKDFFNGYKIEFMVNRLDKSFQRYVKVTEKMGGDDVTTIVGIPIFSGGLLTRIFIATIDVHRSFTENRKQPDYNDLEVIKCAIGQLDEEISRIKSNGMIRIMNEKLEKAAFTDQLTGIYNRMGFNKILDGEITDAGVVLYMDLDNFKKYNDTYGHSVGDAILKLFAGIIRNNIGSLGYAIRYGGDEFVAVIPDKDEAFAEKIAFNIQNELKQEAPDIIKIEGLMLTSSVGIAMYENADRNSLEKSLKWADKALYFVKEREKGKVARWSQIRNML